MGKVHRGPDHFVVMLWNMLRNVYDTTTEHLKEALKNQKHRYDRKAYVHSFKLGHSVWIFNPIRKVGRSPS